MVIVWGSSLYGKVDTVPGLCHVATKFGHLWYIPLIPMGSWIVLSQDGNGWQGKEVGFSFKSFLMAWFRTACVVGIFAGIIGAIVGFGAMNRGGNVTIPIAWVILSLVSIGVMFFSYRIPGFGRASHARAREIAEELGLDERGLMFIDVAYGVIDEDRANWELKKMREREEREVPTDI